MQYYTIKDYTIQDDTMQDLMIQDYTIKAYTIQDYTVQDYNTRLYHARLYNTSNHDWRTFESRNSYTTHLLNGVPSTYTNKWAYICERCPTLKRKSILVIKVLKRKTREKQWKPTKMEHPHFFLPRPCTHIHMPTHTQTHTQTQTNTHASAPTTSICVRLAFLLISQIFQDVIVPPMQQSTTVSLPKG